VKNQKTISMDEFNQPHNPALGDTAKKLKWPHERKLPKGHRSFKDKIKMASSASKSAGILTKKGWGQKYFGTTDNAAYMFVISAVKYGFLEKVNVLDKDKSITGYRWLADPTSEDKKKTVVVSAPVVIASPTPTPSLEEVRARLVLLQEKHVMQTRDLEATDAEIGVTSALIIDMENAAINLEMENIIERLRALPPHARQAVIETISPTMLRAHPDAAIAPQTMAPPANGANTENGAAAPAAN
jgi:hypothetical protein